MKERNTRQKDIITDIMMKTKSHPTAREVCQMVKQVDSSIGQATVYRHSIVYFLILKLDVLRQSMARIITIGILLFMLILFVIVVIRFMMLS